jgi:hypothetical protein
MNMMNKEIDEAFKSLLEDLETAANSWGHLQDTLDKFDAFWQPYLMDDKNDPISYLVREFTRYYNTMKKIKK